jgi:hypothetical protein
MLLKNKLQTRKKWRSCIFSKYNFAELTQAFHSNFLQYPANKTKISKKYLLESLNNRPGITLNMHQSKA